MSDTQKRIVRYFQSDPVYRYPHRQGLRVELQSLLLLRLKFNLYILVFKLTSTLIYKKLSFLTYTKGKKLSFQPLFIS